MTRSLKNELIDAKAQAFNSKKWSDVEDSLRILIDEHGNIECRWAVVRTAFHGGGVVSRHKTATAAILKARSGRSDCSCGCFAVVPESEIENLPVAEDSRSPYAGAR